MVIPTDLIFASSSGLGALGFSLSSFLIQLGSFLIVFLILKRYAFKPIIKLLKERSDLIDDGIKLGESMHKQKTELEEKIEDELSKARTQVDKIISDTHKQSRDMLAEAEKQAAQKAQLVTKEAKEKLERDISLARNKLKTELVGLVSDATEVLIGEKVDAKKDAKIIQTALERSQKS